MSFYMDKLEKGENKLKFSWQWVDTELAAGSKRNINGLTAIFTPREQKGVINVHETCGWLMVKERIYGFALTTMIISLHNLIMVLYDSF